MSCYVLDDEMRGKDRIEEREEDMRGEIGKQIQTRTHAYAAFSDQFQTATKVPTVRKVMITVLQKESQEG